MNETKTYQWSKFNADKSEQYVVRTDNWEELVDGIGKVKGIVPSENPFPDDEGHRAHSVNQTEEVKRCPKHGTQLNWKPAGVSKQTGRPYNGFWSCPERTPAGEYCKEGSKVAGTPKN